MVAAQNRRVPPQTLHTLPRTGMGDQHRTRTEGRRRAAIGAAATLAACLAVATGASAHLDHPVPSFSGAAPLSTTVNAGGENAKWQLVATIPTGNPHTDLDFFTSGGETYASVGTLAAGPNAGGQTIVKLTDKGQVKPSYVTGHPSASCLTTTTSATGLQHDVEATPKGGAFPHSANPSIDRRDTQLLLDATDASGRCHDQGVLGVSGTAKQGGLEIIDVTDPTKPKEIGLTSHVGQAHTVNVDPKRPHIAFDVTQDGVTLNDDGSRSNDASGNALDGFELIDLSSCMNFPAGTTIDQKREACRPKVYRYRYPQNAISQSHSFKAMQSCHELEIYADDKVTCASITATAIFDISGAFDDNGTPTDFTDDKPRGTPLPCAVRPTSTVAEPFKTKALVTDCVTGEGGQSLTVAEWKKIGAPSLEGVRWVGTVPHMGFGATADLVTAKYDSKNDIIAAHESERTASGRFVLTTDERGGGVVPGGASCAPGADNPKGNGGIHAFPIKSFTTSPPRTAEDAHKLWARDSKGEQAVYRTPIRTEPQGSVCTSHVFQQIAGQNRIFMGWYSQGTQVVDFVENPDGTFDFKQAGWFTPEHANTWTSHVFKVERNPDGTFSYWGATGDFLLGDAGRNAIDIYKATLPPPPEPRYPGGGKPPAGTPEIAEAKPTSARCARTTAFDRVEVRPRGRGLRFDVRKRGTRRPRVDILDVSQGRKIVRYKVVDTIRPRRSRFRYTPRRALDPGYYVARFRVRTASGRIDDRLVGLRYSRGRFQVLRPFHTRTSCELVELVDLARPIFGGSTNRPLYVSFRLTQTAEATVTVRRRGRVVARFPTRSYTARRNYRLRFRPQAGRGAYTVTFDARRPGRTSSTTLHARRL